MSFATPTNHIWGNWSLSNTEVIANALKLLGGGAGWGDVVLWHKFDDSGNSGIGVNPTVYGTPTFSPAKFTDGIDNSKTQRMGFDLSGLSNSTVGGCGFWIKHTNASTAAAVQGSFFGHNIPTAGSNMSIACRWESQLWKLCFDVWVGGTRVASLNVDHIWAAGDLEYWEIYWNAAGISGGNKIKIYVDGVEKTVLYSINNSWTAGFVSTDLLFCLDNYKGVSQFIVIGAIIDNFMLFDTNTPRTAAQRNQEDPTGGSAYVPNGTATTIIDMGDLRRLNKLALVSTVPAFTTLKLETRTSDTAPSGAAAGSFVDGDNYLYPYYNGWGTTTPDSYVDMTDLIRYKDSERTARYIEFKLSLANTDTDYSPTVTSLTNFILDYFNMGEFEIGAPAYPTVAGKNTVSTTCYDLMKKLLNKKVTTKVYAGTELISALITDTLLQAGLTAAEYDIDTTIATVPSSGVDPLFENAAVKDILNFALEYLQVEAYPSESDYRIFYKDSKVQLKQIPTAAEADFALWEKYHLFSADRKVDDDLRLSMVTVFSASNTIGAEALFGSDSGGVTGTKTINKNDFVWVNLRPVITTTGDFAVVETDRDIDTGAGAYKSQIQFSVTGTAGTYSITVYGCPINTTSGFIAEWAGDGLNQRGARGRAYYLTNKLIQSDTQAKNLARFLFSYHDDPLFRMSVRLNAIPQLELNDNILAFGKHIAYDNLLVIQAMGLSFSPGSATFKQTLELLDNSQTILPFIWDRNGFDLVPPHGAPDAVNDLSYDVFLPWDWDMGVKVSSDTTVYPQPILF